MQLDPSNHSNETGLSTYPSIRFSFEAQQEILAHMKRVGPIPLRVNKKYLKELKTMSYEHILKLP